MPTTRLGKTGFELSTPIGMGCWQLGGCWSSATDEATHKAALAAYLAAGGNFLDTANVYGGEPGTPQFGWSERMVGEVLKARAADAPRIYVATKAGRAPTSAAPNDHGPASYTYEALSESLAGSAERIGVGKVDLLQLHCPPTSVLAKDSPVWDALERLKAEDRIAFYGVSVETVEEAMLAIAQPGCATVQIIFNMLRLKPAAEFLQAAKAADVGTLIRLPLASGLLTGKCTREYIDGLDAGDHRRFNAAGAFFDKGETWSGLGECLTDVALPAVDELKSVQSAAAARGELHASTTMAQFALRWCLDFEGATIVIPGARNAEQSEANLGAAALSPFSVETHAAVRQIYEARIQAIMEKERW